MGVLEGGVGGCRPRARTPGHGLTAGLLAAGLCRVGQAGGAGHPSELGPCPQGAVQAGQLKVPPGYHPLDVEKEWGKLHVAILEREKQLRAEYERWVRGWGGQRVGGALWRGGKPPEGESLPEEETTPPRLGIPHWGRLRCEPQGRQGGPRREGRGLWPGAGSRAGGPHSRRLRWVLWAAGWSVFSAS